MKLRNKKTGQVENFCIDKDQICSCDRAFVYNSLAQLQEAGWKDYEEPSETALDEMIRKLKSDFEVYPDEWNNLEDAKKAVEKLGLRYKGGKE